MPNQQPWLHDLTVLLAAPTAVLSGANGQILRGGDGTGGVQGVLHSDVRVLNRAELSVDTGELVGVAGGLDGASAARFTAIARSLGDEGPDPTVRVEQHRRVVAGVVDEEIRVISYASVPVNTHLHLTLSADASPVEQVKSGRPSAPVHIDFSDSGPRWGSDGVSVTVHAEGDGLTIAPAGHGLAELTWPVNLPPRGTLTFRWSLHAEVEGAPVTGSTATLWPDVEITCDDRRLPALARRSIADLRALLMTPTDEPDAVFAAAGAPWYFTLFGRDSLWTARLMLPFGWELAAGTLRALAARQGTKDDPDTMEAPGKIPHELRRSDDASWLPPLYYGTIDATPLWICLLHDAWRAGMPQDQVRALIPNLQAALTWVVELGDEDGDGFLEYLDRSGRGLANQGWKDSGDSIRFRDGTIAEGPVALCEAQAYAYEAAAHGADLLDAFALDGAEELRTWATQLADRFRSRFWVEDETGPYPALALDGHKTPVDSLTSNIGHLLGTGILDAEQSARVVDRLTSPGMDSGYGLRTMDSREGGYSPLSYHCGSVWPHDTAIAIWSMTRAGFAHRATGLVDGLLAAAERFDARLPELYSGDSPDQGPGVAPYPASCRPQAWAAASVGAIVQCLLGLHTDIPSNEVLIAPTPDPRFGALQVQGIAAAEETFAVHVTADGTATLHNAPASARLTPYSHS